MTQDARFEDGHEAPLNLGAMDSEDLQVLSSLVQDAVFPITEMRWYASERRFAILLNRVRWEDNGKDRHGVERVQSVLALSNVLNVSSQGIDRSQSEMILSLLSITFEPGEDGAGDIVLTLAGDGALRLSVEALEAQLRDVTRPYKAPSRKLPAHNP